MAARSGSWQVVTGIGLMLIRAALQWANTAVLIGGQGHISRTSQTGASATLLTNGKQIHTHRHTQRDALALDQQWHLCFSAAVRG